LQSKKLSLGLSDFGCVLNWFRSFVIVNWSYGQVVGKNAESSVISGVRDHDLFSFRVDVSVRADLVTESIAVMGSSLSGVGETK
jgi:hypothetical protein